VRIGVVEALARDLVDVRAEELAGELGGAFRLEPVAGGDLLALDVLEHQHLLGHVRVDHLRHDQVVVVLEQAGDQLRVVRLLAEVELAADVRLELLGQRRELEQARRVRLPLGEAGRRPHQVEVDVDLLDDARPPDLDDDVAAVLQ